MSVLHGGCVHLSATDRVSPRRKLQHLPVATPLRTSQNNMYYVCLQTCGFEEQIHTVCFHFAEILKWLSDLNLIPDYDLTYRLTLTPLPKSKRCHNTEMSQQGHVKT